MHSKMITILEPSPEVIETIIGKLKTNGMFDEMRRNCLADIDTKPAFQNLRQRIENYVNSLLADETWTPSLNKNQLRSKVRSSVMRSGMLTTGVEHILHQVVDAKMYTEFLPKISEFISENHDNLLKELRPQSDLELVQNEPESMIDMSQNQDVDMSVEENSVKNEPVEENDEENVVEPEGTQVPDIPEGAANTLRTLIQSLMTTNIQSLFTIGNDEENNEAKSESSAQGSGSSPSINSSQIESFTDDENDAAERPVSTDGGPRTPDESANNSISSDVSASATKQRRSRMRRKHSYNASSSEFEDQDDIHEDLGKADSDASFESAGDIGTENDCEVVVDDGDHENIIESEGAIEQVATDNDDQVDAASISETFENSVEEVEVSDVAGNENIVIEDSIASYDQRFGSDELPVEIPPADEEDVEETPRHSHREKKRRHKKHRRRRYSSIDDESDESGRAATFDSDRDSSEEAREEEVEHVKSRSRKKKKKKRSKKLKRSKSKARDSSQEKLQWETSSEYRRSSLSPSHPELNQRHSFVPSPPSQQTPVHFDDNNRGVKVEPAFMQVTPRFRDPYAVDHDEHRLPMQENADHPFPIGHPDKGMPPFPPSNFPRSPPHHYPQHGHPRFSPSRFPYGHPRFSPPYSRMPYPMRPGSPPPRRYSPTFDYFRPPMRSHFDIPGPPRSPPHQRRFPPGMPPHPHLYPGPPDERFMMRPGMSGSRMMPPGPMMRPEMPPGPPQDMRRPPMR